MSVVPKVKAMHIPMTRPRILYSVVFTKYTLADVNMMVIIPPVMNTVYAKNPHVWCGSLMAMMDNATADTATCLMLVTFSRALYNAPSIAPTAIADNRSPYDVAVDLKTIITIVVEVI